VSIKEIRESGLLEYYVLGTLSEQDAQRVEGYLMQYPELQADYYEMQKAMQAYAKANAVIPDSNLEQTTKELIQKSGSKTPTTVKSIQGDAQQKLSKKDDGIDWKSLAIPALLAAALFFSWYAFTKGQEYNNLQKEYIEYQEDCETKQEEANRKQRIFASLNTPNNRTIEITPTDNYQQTDLLFHYNEADQRNYIQVKNLPQVAANQAFQLWSLKDGVDPIPLTVFKDGDDLIIPVDFESGTGTYAITIEDEAGATSPTLSRLIGTIGV